MSYFKVKFLFAKAMLKCNKKYKIIIGNSGNLHEDREHCETRSSEEGNIFYIIILISSAIKGIAHSLSKLQIESCSYILGINVFANWLCILIHIHWHKTHKTLASVKI